MLWKKIEDYPNYSVSDQGDIRNDTSGVTLKATDNGSGYLYVSLYRNGVPKRYSVHRLVLEAFDPLDPTVAKLYQAHHKDGDRYNNALDNLEWILASEHRNESIKRSKSLSQETVINILDDYFVYNLTKLDICERYKVNIKTIADLVNFRYYTKLIPQNKLEYYQEKRKEKHSNRMDRKELEFVKYHFLVNGKIIYRKGISKRAIKQACKNAKVQLDRDFNGDIDLMKFRGIISPSTGEPNEDK